MKAFAIAGCLMILCICLMTACADKITKAIDPTTKDPQAYSDHMNRLISAMDPFAIQNADGTFSMDFQAFLNANKDLSAEDLSIATQLYDGIPIGNAKILQEMQNPTIMSIQYQWHWWGMSARYTGQDSQNIINGFAAGGAVFAFFVPLIGMVGGLSAAVLQIYQTCYGGFKVNLYWGFPLVPPWLSRP
jgi:hypothetical protein